MPDSVNRCGRDCAMLLTPDGAICIGSLDGLVMNETIRRVDGDVHGAGRAVQNEL